MLIVENDYQEAVKEFENENNIKYYRMDQVSDGDEGYFIAHALRMNQTYDFTDISYYGGGGNKDQEVYDASSGGDIMIDGVKYCVNILREKNPKLLWKEYYKRREHIKHIDQETAYTNYDKTKYYEGLLGKIWEYRLTDKIEELGFYLVKNVKVNNPLLKRMRVLEDYNVYFSPELKYYKDNGCDFDIVCGCWGSRLDIKWTDAMFEKSEGEKVRNYIKWFGTCIAQKPNSKMYFDTDNEDYIQNLAYVYANSDVTIGYHKNPDWTDTEGVNSEKRYKIVISKPRKTIYHQSQICAGITSYQRIMMLDQLSKIKPENLIRVCVDGVYFRGEIPELVETFREKGNINLGNNASLFRSPYAYTHLACEPETAREWLGCGKARKYNGQYEVHIGAGGCGKTHKNLVDSGLIKALYIAHSWKLCSAKKDEYPKQVTGSIPNQRLTFDKPGEGKPYPEQYNEGYNVLIVDEISTLSKEIEDKILRLYPAMKIIWCGDINEKGNPYQCPPFSATGADVIPFDIKENFKIIKHVNNRRCECPALLEILTNLRNWIDNGKLVLSPQEIIDKLINKYRINYLEDDGLWNETYQAKDLILCRTHNRCFIFDEKFKDIEKYKVIAGDGVDLMTSQILYTKPTIGKFKVGFGHKIRKSTAVGSYSIKHGFTIDCIQGETARDNLYIDNKNNISTQHLYTALSRAKLISQINFIGK